MTARANCFSPIAAAERCVPTSYGRNFFTRCWTNSAYRAADSTAYVTVLLVHCLLTARLSPQCKDKCDTATRESRLEFTRTSLGINNAMPYRIARQDS